jgi:hypothetical protein
MNTEDAKSIRELARRVGFSHTTIRDWLARPDWPFQRTPPFSAAVVELVQDWIDSDTRDLRSNPPIERGPAEEVDAPGLATWRARDLLDPATPFYLGKVIGATLLNELTRPDLESFAEQMTLVMKFCMAGVAEQRGEPGIAATGTPAYFESLFSAINRDEWYGLMNGATTHWLARRFIDRPGWWSELPTPMEKPPHDPELKPLPHRAKGA